jgi:REP element-mobilizing transposase RayT
MANSFLSLQVHVVFSTKNRERWISPQVECEVWAYLSGIIKNQGGKALQIGGIEDHVHLLLAMPATLALSNLVKSIKGDSSKWISQTWPSMREFRWQDGYGAFTVGHSQIADTIAYIKNQRQHHQRKSFEEEYKAFLKVHGIEVEDQYIFG